MINNNKNPFAQSEFYWQVKFTILADAAGTADDSFEDIALVVSGFETDEANGVWTFELLFQEMPDMEEIKRRLIVISALHKVPLPEATCQKLEQQDWLSQVARNFPPLTIGRFYIHGSHVEETPAPGAIAIQVDAGAAFGSGEHGTTRCCLEAMDWLARSRDFSHILDMGCGSGVLAIAAAKLWRTNVLAVDIDPVAVRVTHDNARDNREQGRVEAAESDGYASERVKRAGDNGQYELIISNILARPLVKFAPDLYKHLQPGGFAILSGLLASQETMVKSAHIMQGLKFKKRFIYEQWCTLVLEKQ